MSEQAVNPERETAPQPIKDEASAVASIADRLNPETDNQPAKRARPEPKAAPEDDAEEASEEGATEEQPESTEPTSETEDGELELPESLSKFAEALEVEPEKLMAIKVPVNIDGKVSEVTLSEAISGYQKDQDYRRKTEALSQQRKQFDAHTQQAVAQFQQKAQAVDVMIDALTAEIQAGPKDEDLAYLLNDNPAEYIRQTQAIKAKQDRLVRFQQERGQQLQQQQQEHLREIGKYRQSQQQYLLQHFPDINSDSQKANALQARVMKVLSSFDYNEDELKQYLGGPFDGRLVRVALKLDELMQQSEKGKAAVKKVALKPKIAKPGTSSGKKGADEKLDDLRAKLRRHGKSRGRNPSAEKDAVAFVRNLLE